MSGNCDPNVTMNQNLMLNLLSPQSGVSEAQRILQEGVDMTSSSWRTQWLPASLLPPFTATASIIGELSHFLPRDDSC